MPNFSPGVETKKRFQGHFGAGRKESASPFCWNAGETELENNLF